jgi:nitroreductase
MTNRDQRTNRGGVPAELDAAAVLALLGRHRSIRRFRDDPVDDEVVRVAVRAAQQASTSSNVQGYALLRVRDAARRAQLAHLAGDQVQVERAGAFFVVCADQRRHALAAADEGRAYEPNLETFLVAVIDAALFAQNLIVAFEAHGLGICCIGGLRNRLPEVDALLALPEHVLPLFGLCVGVPDEAPVLRPRLPLDAVLLEERYPDDAAMRAAMDRYDAAMREYYLARTGKPHTWRGGVTRKFERPVREHLHHFYASKGARWR